MHSSAPIWTHDALHFARFGTPYLGEEEANESWLRFGQLVANAKQAGRKNSHTLADNLYKRADHLLQQLVDPDKPPAVYIVDNHPGHHAIGEPGGRLRLPDLNFETWLSWDHGPRDPGTFETRVDPSEVRHSKVIWRAILELRPSASSRKAIRSRAASIFQQGLERRLGSQLSPAEQILYMHHVARRIPQGHHRVCETCAICFRGKFARQCPDCRRSPDRPTPKPWHAAILLTDKRPAAPHVQLKQTSNGATLTITKPANRGPKQLTYHSRCSACGASFLTTDGRQHYCQACGTSTERSRRSRLASRARSGPQNSQNDQQE